MWLKIYNKLNNLFGRLTDVVFFVVLYQNWLTVILAYLGRYWHPELVLKTRSGLKFLVPSKDFYWSLNINTPSYIREVILYGVYNAHGFNLNNGDVVIDIGANIGSFSVLSAQQVGEKGKVVCFEPEQRNFYLLSQNIELNTLSNIIAIQKAVSNRNDKMKLYLGKTSGSHSLEFKSKKAVSVETITLEEIFERYSIKKCDFLKVDCEGAEYRIFRSVKPKIFTSIKKIVMEYHSSGKDGRDIDKIKSILIKTGFQVITYPHRNPISGFLFAKRP